MNKFIQLSPANKLLKRAFDIGVSFLIVFLIAPVMLIVAIAIRLQGAGPVFYRMIRFASDGTEIKVYKFRTMIIEDKGSMARWATNNDPRITRLGGFLRRTALDELPMLFNVLKGDMSIVGPRVKHLYEYERYKSVANEEVKIKPGITSLKRGSYYMTDSDSDDIIQQLYTEEIEYISNWTLWNDVKAIWYTIVRGFISSNAY